jgi:hypothetical protein
MLIGKCAAIRAASSLRGRAQNSVMNTYFLSWTPDLLGEDKKAIAELRKLFKKAATEQWFPVAGIIAKVIKRVESHSTDILTSEIVNIDLLIVPNSRSILTISEVGMLVLLSDPTLFITLAIISAIGNHYLEAAFSNSFLTSAIAILSLLRRSGIQKRKCSRQNFEPSHARLTQLLLQHTF